mmetsp:Transcript_4478/g.7199  ORF Transcript_4478/g.7199 Transcript_4478/m.7199 type:complete len:207 (-) Transcript_4478:222-842(-)
MGLVESLCEKLRRMMVVVEKGRRRRIQKENKDDERGIKLRATRRILQSLVAIALHHPEATLRIINCGVLALLQDLLKKGEGEGVWQTALQLVFVISSEIKIPGIPPLLLANGFAPILVQHVQSNDTSVRRNSLGALLKIAQYGEDELRSVRMTGVAQIVARQQLEEQDHSHIASNEKSESMQLLEVLLEKSSRQFDPATKQEFVML